MNATTSGSVWPHVWATACRGRPAADATQGSRSSAGVDATGCLPGEVLARGRPSSKPVRARPLKIDGSRPRLHHPNWGTLPVVGPGPDPPGATGGLLAEGDQRCQLVV